MLGGLHKTKGLMVESDPDQRRTKGELPEPVCVCCFLPVQEGCVKCPNCQSFQDFRRHVNFALPILSLILAVLTLVPIAVFSFLRADEVQKVEFQVLGYGAENAIGADGILGAGNNFGVFAQVYNLDNKTLILDDGVNCSLRNVITKVTPSSPEQPTDFIKQPNGEVISIIIEDHSNDLFDLHFYIERRGYTILDPGESVIVEWKMGPDAKLELYPQFLNGASTEEGDLVYDEVSDFYSVIESRLRILYASWPNVAGIRGPIQNTDGSLKSFFVNLDCGITISEGGGRTAAREYAEFHLELLVEYSGDEGFYPRWKIGKNIGYGAGNGAGNGGAAAYGRSERGWFGWFRNLFSSSD